MADGQQQLVTRGGDAGAPAVVDQVKKTLPSVSLSMAWLNACVLPHHGQAFETELQSTWTALAQGAVFLSNMKRAHDEVLAQLASARAAVEVERAARVEAERKVRDGFLLVCIASAMHALGLRVWRLAQSYVVVSPHARAFISLPALSSPGGGAV